MTNMETLTNAGLISHPSKVSQAMQDKISSGQKYAEDVLKVEGTPTFFINGDEIVGEAAFEEFAGRINALLKS